MCGVGLMESLHSSGNAELLGENVRIRVFLQVELHTEGAPACRTHGGKIALTTCTRREERRQRGETETEKEKPLSGFVEKHATYVSPLSVNRILTFDPFGSISKNW